MSLDIFYIVCYNEYVVDNIYIKGPSPSAVVAFLDKTVLLPGGAYTNYLLVGSWLYAVYGLGYLPMDIRIRLL